jgi:hypothetical protein
MLVATQDLMELGSYQRPRHEVGDQTSERPPATAMAGRRKPSAPLPAAEDT